MTIHFYLERKQLKSVERSIYCYLRGFQNKRSIILNTGQKINPVYWNKKNERAINKGRHKYPGSFELNNFLGSYAEEIKRTTRIFLADHRDADFESIKNLILEKFVKSKSSIYTFFEALDFFVESRKRDLSPDSLRKFKTLKNHLKDFEYSEGNQLSFNKMNLLFYDSFLLFLINQRGMVNNSAFKMIGLLKIFLNWSYDRGIHQYLEFKRFKIKEDKVDIVTLTDEELVKIKNLDFTQNSKLDKARDLFVFGCYTGGRFTDLTNIGWSDIRNNCWYLRAHKTKDILEIPLMVDALKIIAKYRDFSSPLPRLSNQKLNIYIKEVCAFAGIDEQIRIIRYSGSTPIILDAPKYRLVSAHTARRTFITLSLLKGVKAEIVMSISGHKNFRTFKKYLNISVRDKELEMKKAWQSLG